MQAQALIPTLDADWLLKYDKIKATEIPDNAIKLISKDWMLVTSGAANNFNTMTASWGSLGEMWNMPISMMAVRSSRYTHEFLEKSDTYTLSFFTNDYKKALTICGTKSGRDTDKIKESGLSPILTPSGSISFGEARLIIECRKIYAAPFDKNAFVDQSIYDKWYMKESMHTMFLGEIVNVWVKK